ncbi:MAG: molecular chaperone TorD family protein [Chloroflexi bacterium]|nr:molecular chaperone TorD family protein [Chloroflexota bacterium]
MLSRLLYEYPDGSFLQSLVDDDVFAEYPLGDTGPETAAGLRRLQAWSRQCGTPISREALDTLRVDYTRLFMGPGTVLAAPWESVYFSEERMVFQEQTLQVRAWYAQFGLELASRVYEPDDHIGLELSFIAHLAQQSLQALEHDDLDQVQRALQAQRTFMSEHLLRWAPTWCEQVQQHARTDFYRGVGLLTRGTLAQLSAWLDRQAAVERVA